MSVCVDVWVDVWGRERERESIHNQYVQIYDWLATCYDNILYMLPSNIEQIEKRRGGGGAHVHVYVLHMQLIPHKTYNYNARIPSMYMSMSMYMYMSMSMYMYIHIHPWTACNFSHTQTLAINAHHHSRGQQQCDQWQEKQLSPKRKLTQWYRQGSLIKDARTQQVCHSDYNIILLQPL